jgi:hypothetical protein
MDPYLEDPAYWSDFHSTFVNYWREAVADALPPNYEARIDETVYLVEHDPDARKLGRPDVSITQRENGALGAGSAASSAVATLEPVTIPLQLLDGPRETYIEILHRPDRTLVTVLELLSPANKTEPGRSQYWAKRDAILYQNVHLIELDLLVGGRRPPLQREPPPADYYYFLSRAEERPDCKVYSWTVRQPLPRLPVPLRAPDPDIHIDLSAVFAVAYERGRFGKSIDYRSAPTAHLKPQDTAWAHDTALGR